MMVDFSSKTIESVREYWDRRPCNVRHSNSPVGSRQYFDEVKERKYFVEPHIPKFAQFDRWQGKRVLEIGCGIGTDTIEFARAGARVTAVDLSGESLSLAQNRAKVFGLSDTIQFYQANAEEIATVVPLEQYDLVYSFGVIHHTPHPRAAIEQIRNYMKPDGLLKIMVYNRNSWKVFWILMNYGKEVFWEVEEVVARYSEAQTGCPVTYTYTKESVNQLLDGFEIVDSQIEHIFPFYIPDYIRYRYRKEWYFRYLPQPVFNWLEHRWGWHLCVTAKLPN